MGEIAHRLIGEKIAHLSESIASGQLADFASYRHTAGQIQGLREALDLLGEAATELAKR